MPCEFYTFTLLKKSLNSGTVTISCKLKNETRFKSGVFPANVNDNWYK